MSCRFGENAPIVPAGENRPTSRSTLALPSRILDAFTTEREGTFISSLQQRLILILSGLLPLTLGVWLASQHGFVTHEARAFVGVWCVLLDALVYLVPIWLAAAGLGVTLRYAVLRDQAVPLSVQLAIGFAALLLIDWLLLWAGAMNQFTAWFVVGIGIILLARHVWKHRAAASAQAGTGHHFWLVLACPAAALFLTACACPPLKLWMIEAFGYDVASYHLQVPREWLAHGQMRGLTHNAYSFLPLLVEAGYAQIAAMRGSMFHAMYAAQLMHASVAVLTAWLIGSIVQPRAGRTAGRLAGVTFLCIPWVVILGSLAYNEMFVFAFVAAAWWLALDPQPMHRRKAIVLGSMLGAATLAKLTAGPAFVLPLLLVMLLRLNRRREEDRHLRNLQPTIITLLIIALSAAVVLSPYFIRNTLWTGNPIFPFATDTFGSAHWSNQQATLWRDYHHHPQPGRSTMQALQQGWLLSAGYGTVFSQPRTMTDSHIVDTFAQQGGLPLLWLWMLVTAIMALRVREHRALVLAMTMTIIMQLLFWLLLTHQQDRFAVYTVMPACVIVGLGIGALRDKQRDTTRAGVLTMAVTVIATLTAMSYTLFFQQTLSSVDVDAQGQPRVQQLQPWRIIHSLPRQTGLLRWAQGDATFFDHPVNRLPEDSFVYVAGDVMRVLYMDRPFRYHSRFDEGSLVALMRSHPHDDQAVTKALRDMGITHVWVNWNSLPEEQPALQYDPLITIERFERLASNWRQVYEDGPGAIYALSRVSDPAQHLREILQLNPDSVQAHVEMANLAASRRQLDVAQHHYEQVLLRMPQHVEAKFNLAGVLMATGQSEYAANMFESLAATPGAPPQMLQEIGKAMYRLGRPMDALRHFHDAARLAPQWHEPAMWQAWILATDTDAQYRDGKEAVKLAVRACEATQYQQPDSLDVLAAAYAEAGRFDEAISTATLAIDRARVLQLHDMAGQIELRRQLYESAQPYRIRPTP